MLCSVHIDYVRIVQMLSFELFPIYYALVQPYPASSPTLGQGWGWRTASRVQQCGPGHHTGALSGSAESRALAQIEAWSHEWWPVKMSASILCHKEGVPQKVFISFVFLFQTL